MPSNHRLWTYAVLPGVHDPASTVPAAPGGVAGTDQPLLPCRVGAGPPAGASSGTS